MKRREDFKFGSIWRVVEEGEEGLAVISIDGLRCIASWGEGWDHVSVSRQDKVPDWFDMCRVKNMFFEPEECVIQYHPPQSVYKNDNKFVLHMWKPHNIEIPMPPLKMV